MVRLVTTIKGFALKKNFKNSKSSNNNCYKVIIIVSNYFYLC